MAEHIAGGKHLPEAVHQQLVEKTDGVPLFVEKMTKAAAEVIGYGQQADEQAIHML